MKIPIRIPKTTGLLAAGLIFWPMRPPGPSPWRSNVTICDLTGGKRPSGTDGDDGVGGGGLLIKVANNISMMKTVLVDGVVLRNCQAFGGTAASGGSTFENDYSGESYADAIDNRGTIGIGTVPVSLQAA